MNKKQGETYYYRTINYAMKEIILFGNGNDLTASADNVVDDRKYSKARVACLAMSFLEALATQGSTL